jgi:digeranylgeranylglycerophospholipid reductase
LEVAIIGAGISGLSCAIELERNNITPTIFEKKSYIGDYESHVTAIINVLNRPINDFIKYSEQKLNINIKPIQTVNKITHHSSKKTTVVNGNLGYLIKRNCDEDSLMMQLFSQLDKTQVVFNQNADYNNLQDNYDYVVIANGDNNYTNELGCWHERVSGWIRGAVVLGDFNPNEIIMWINKDYTNKGYAYLTPFSDKKASVSLYVPYGTEKEIDHYWQLFVYTENIKYTIIEEFKRNHHSGSVFPLKVNNILFAGSSGGTVDPFLGFSQVNSIMQGVYAAQSIANNYDYEDVSRKLVQKNNDLWEFRKSFDTMSNKAYDKIISSIGFLGVKELIYKTQVNVFKVGASALKLKNKITNERSDSK